MSLFSPMLGSTSTRRRIPLPLLLLCTMLWCHVAMAQSTTPTSSVRPTSSATPTSATSANGGLTATPSLTMYDVPTVTACSPYRITWGLTGEDPSNQQIAIKVVNIDVPQSIPPASSSTAAAAAAASSIVSRASSAPASSSAAATAAATSRAASSPSAVTPASSRAASTAASAAGARRDLVSRANINQTVIVQAANVAYTWTVNVPEGRYYFLGLVGDQFGTTAQTNQFTVVQGSNTSCLQVSSPKPSSSPTKNVPTTSATVGAADAGSDSGSGSGIAGGAIAGIVIGTLAVLALIAGFFLWRRRRARKAPLYVGGEKPDLGSDNGHGQRAIALSSLNAEESMTGDTEKDAQRSFGSDSGHGYQPVLLAGAAARSQRMPPQHTPGDPFNTAPSTPTDELYSGLSDETYASRRASEIPSPGPAAHLPRSRSLSHPAEGQISPLVSTSDSSSPPPSGGVGRTGSKKRKPVPSLGAELRGQLRDEDRNGRGSGPIPPIPSVGESTPKQSFQIMPDPPMNPDH